MAEKIADAVLEIRTDTKKLLTGMKSAQQSANKGMKAMEIRADKFSKLMKGAAGLGGIAVAFAGISRALKKVFDATLYSAQVRQTRMAFRSIAEDSGAMADDIISNMRRMSGETISELDMMLSANRASLLGIPVDKFDDLMGIARASATATGESVGKMFDDIVKGIGRGSPLILDNLGIILKVEEANQKWAEAQGVSTAEMTKQHQSQALMNEVLFKGIDIIRKVGEAGQQLTDVERWQQTAAAAADFRGELGMNLLQAMGQIFEGSTKILGVWEETLKTTRLVNEAMAEGAMQGNIAELQERYNSLTDQIETLTEAQEAGMRTQGRTRKETDAEIEALGRRREEIYQNLFWMKKANAENKETQKVTGELTDKTEDWGLKIKEASEYLGNQTTDLDEYFSKQTQIVAGFQDFTDQQIGLNGLMGGFRDGLVRSAEAVDGLTSAYNTASFAGMEFVSGGVDATEGLIEKTTEYRDLMEDMTSDTIVRYGEAFGEALQYGIDAQGLLREAMKETVAIGIESFAKMWALEAAAAYAKAFTNPANLPKAIGLTAVSVAALAGAGYVRGLATGGDFETRGPQMIMVGENPGGRERITATPLSSPNINGPGGQMVHVTVNVGSKQFYDDIGRATDNGELTIHPRSIKR